MQVYSSAEEGGSGPAPVKGQSGGDYCCGFGGWGLEVEALGCCV